MLVTTVLTIVPCAVVILCYSGVLLYVLGTACRLKITTARKELRITSVFGAIFLVTVGDHVIPVMQAKPFLLGQCREHRLRNHHPKGRPQLDITIISPRNYTVLTARLT